MELWIVFAIAAALFQTIRFMLQKVLSTGTLSTAGATIARFAYAMPAALVLTSGYLFYTGQSVPALGGVFWPYALAGAIGQIMATLCVVALFRQRNFAVGITFKKTEVIQTALAGWIVLSEPLSGYGWLAILIGLVGVLILSDTPNTNGSFRERFLTRAVALGLLSGAFFAMAAIGYRGATLQVASDDPIIRAGVSLVLVTLSQTVMMGLWMRFKQPGELTRVWQARRTAVWVGITSMAGSFGWFVAFTLQTAAYVQAVGQIELIFSIMASTLFFKEKITAKEIAGIAVLTLSILMLILIL
ncbi:EamA-like transporter family protein [Thalassococcus halodurans]|uniref:EamA-like transporter family protein n=1 Tax=Thalassococcus halodurans TaxID=373675 RepID=A0A1H6A093_9RHOB|nr:MULTISPECIES: DMT family transporter [Thalassococcus]MBO6868061.1 EamA family transporter [Thalassococcus sp.]SEG41830.1 EamA-like transporter family protein [Thalassococcus halodurans]